MSKASREAEEREVQRLHNFATSFEALERSRAARLLDLVRDFARPGGLEDELEPWIERDEEEEDT